MSNVFLYKPVGVHLVDLKTNKFTHTYVFVGGVSDNIMKHLEMLAKNPDRSDDVLSKFYGPGYHKLLFAQHASKTGGVDAAKLNEQPVVDGEMAGLDDQMAGLDMEGDMQGEMLGEMSGEMMDDMLGDLSGTPKLCQLKPLKSRWPPALIPHILMSILCIQLITS